MVAALDLVVQIARVPSGERRVTHISEVIGIDPETQRILTEDIFRLRRTRTGDYAEGGRLAHTGYLPEFAEELIDKGFMGIEVFT
jgi:hypothetical protein